MYNIDLPKRVVRQLDKVLSKDYPSVSKAIQNLRETPRPTGCKKLLESFYRIRIGDYRVIYWIDDANKNIVIPLSTLTLALSHQRLCGNPSSCRHRP